MLLEALIGVCVFIVLVGVACLIYFNEEKAKEQRASGVREKRISEEFNSFSAELIAANAEASRKAGLVPPPPPMKDGRGKDVVVSTPPGWQYATGGYTSPSPDRTRHEPDYLTSVAMSSSFDSPSSSRTCSSSSSSSHSSSYSSSSGSSSSSDSGSSSSSCD